MNDDTPANDNADELPRLTRHPEFDFLEAFPPEEGFSPMFDMQRQDFKEKFGRDLRPGEPLFFDREADEVKELEWPKVALMSAIAMFEAGFPNKIIYAYLMTGLLVTPGNDGKLSDEAKGEFWYHAEEYARIRDTADLPNAIERRLHSEIGDFVRSNEAALIVAPSGHMRVAFPDFDALEEVHHRLLFIPAVFVKSMDRDWFNYEVANFLDLVDFDEDD